MSDEAPDLSAVLTAVEGFADTLSEGVLDAADGNHLLGSLILTATIAKVLAALFPDEQEAVLRGVLEAVMMRLPRDNAALAALAGEASS